MAEAIQQAVVSALDIDGLIESTASLRLDGKEIEQPAMYGALSSLWSREVRRSMPGLCSPELD